MPLEALMVNDANYVLTVRLYKPSRNYRRTDRKAVVFSGKHSPFLKSKPRQPSGWRGFCLIAPASRPLPVAFFEPVGPITVAEFKALKL